MIKVEMKTDIHGKFVVELKTVLDIIEYYQAIIDTAKLYNNKNIKSKGLADILKGEEKE